MTCIAWDGKHLAVDRMATDGHTSWTIKKYQQLPDGTILAAAGDTDRCLAMMNWYAQGAYANNFPEDQKRNDTAVALVVLKGGVVVEYGVTPFPMEFTDKIQAWGSGKDIAIGAMEFGASAEEAVEVANRRCTTCGGGVDVFPRLPPEQWSEEELATARASGAAPVAINTLKGGDSHGKEQRQGRPGGQEARGEEVLDPGASGYGMQPEA